MNFKFTKISILIILLSLVFPRASIVNAVLDYLEAPKDIITNITPEATAIHNIRFGLPLGTQAIEEDDYITITMVYFSNIQPPKGLGGGYTGNPIYAINGNKLKITGIRIEPDNYLLIKDVYAKNPPMAGALDIYITISHDEAGQNIRNQAHIMATNTDGSIIMRADIPANIGMLQISGVGAPGMIIAITENNVIIGSCDTNNAGEFSQMLTGFTPQEHTIMVYGVDPQDRYTPNIEIKVFIQPYILIEYPGIILPPTISIDKEQITRGEELTVSGMGVPGYRAMVYTESPLKSFEVTVGANGNYSYTMTNTTDMDLGDHKVYSILQDGDGNSSLFSFELIFKVIDQVIVPPDEDPECDIGQGDLSCDGHVNLTDFSILLYYWGSISVFADINNDHKVNLIDFSIMMFFWQT